MVHDSDNQTFYLEIVTPEALSYAGQVSRVDIPGIEGMFGVLPNHAPLIAALDSGVVTIIANGTEVAKRFFVMGGVAEVTQERCTILASSLVDIETVNRTEVEKEVVELASKLKATVNMDEKIRLQQRLLQLDGLLRAL